MAAITLRGILACAALCALNVAAADFSFVGDFHQDDEHRNFSITTSKEGKITIRTLSYAGGTNAAGVEIPAGGFDPTLSVFDDSGALIALNRDGGCGSVPADPVTALCWDSVLSFSAPAGTYQVVLTESENTPYGPSSKNPFVYDGAGNFTNFPDAPVSDGFWDLSLHQRSSEFALDILGADSAQLGLTPNVSALVNAASALAGSLAPNNILSYYDPGLTGTPVTVTIGGAPATVLYSGAGQLNFVVPGGVTVNSTVPLQISHSGDLLFSFNLKVNAVDPALFSANSQGTGQGAILNQDYGANSPSNPAKRGSYIMVYGTGFGAVLPPGADGLSLLASGVTATVGGVPADVTYAGLAPGQTTGLQQINVHLPDNTPQGAAVSIQLSIDGVATQSGITLAVN